MEYRTQSEQLLDKNDFLIWYHPNAFHLLCSHTCAMFDQKKNWCRCGVGCGVGCGVECGVGCGVGCGDKAYLHLDIHAIILVMGSLYRERSNGRSKGEEHRKEAMGGA